MEGLFSTVFNSWGRILAGRHPALSIEITRECPLRCPGCYAYGDDHLGGALTLRELRDLKGLDLVEGVLALVRRHRPLHVSLVGGEPLVRYRELGVILPRLSDLGIYTQLVTSAVRPIPAEWAGLRRLQLVVSIDGLQPEHDARRTPATYDRILKHIAGHRMTVHWTITRQQLRQPDYLESFAKFWSDQAAVSQIWVSLYTPQVGEVSDERLTSADRRRVVAELMALRERYPRLRMPRGLLEVYAAPPSSPSECIFAQTTACVSADFTTPVTPCQLGGQPDCGECGCMASAGLAALGRHRLPVGVRVETLFQTSLKVGAVVRRLREGAPRETQPRALPGRSVEETGP